MTKRSRRVNSFRASRSPKFILWFKETGIKDVPLVGGKNASLGEMYRKLTPKGVRVPNGFSITAAAYRYLLKEAGIADDIRRILRGLNTHDMANLQSRGRQIRALIRSKPLPLALETKVREAYRQLEKEFGRNVDVAVRSSATAEDLPDASFAGQQETFLNIRGGDALLDACRRCFASLFTDRAISYRQDKKFSHFEIALSIGVQKMVRSDLSSSGVMFSIDTESGFRNAVLINSIYGLGENIVQGAVTPDEFYVFKPTLKTARNAILTRKLGAKNIKMVYGTDQTNPTKNIPVRPADRNLFSITDKEVLTLAKWAVIIEEHYSKEAGHFKPMDMEWAKDGRTGELFIVQARPETVTSRRDVNVLESYVLAKRGRVLAQGASVGSKIGQGEVNIILQAKDINKFKPGQVLVTEMTDPDWEPIMKIASAIVTNSGGRTCHAAIISRELGIPCIVGTSNGTTVLTTRSKVTVSCAEGEKGFVYAGLLPFHVNRTNLKTLTRPKTKVMMILANPESAFTESFIPNDGVGLAREEMIIANSIMIHPLALAAYPKLKDRAAVKKIASLTRGYDNKKEFYIDKLASGIAMIGAAFYPKDVIVRLTDLRSNEYADLIGGREFEQDERNPMIGWRGASRYYDPKYTKAFAMECEALRRVRDVIGLTNVKVMVPFCRTVEEGKKVLELLAKYGLKRGQNGLQVYVMCEIPSNVILADQFAKIFDGFSIGSNDLTQLTLGVDRDSALVAHVYDERNEAVKRLLTQVISTAKKAKVKIGICGQAPSDFPEIATFLVEQGIDSISLNPDTVIKTTLAIGKKEKALRR